LFRGAGNRLENWSTIERLKVRVKNNFSISAKFGWGVCNFFGVNMLHTGRLVFGEV